MCERRNGASPLDSVLVCTELEGRINSISVMMT